MSNENSDGVGCVVWVGIALMLVLFLLSVHIKKLRARTDDLEHRVRTLELAR